METEFWECLLSAVKHITYSKRPDVIWDPPNLVYSQEEMVELQSIDLVGVEY
jgi:hypothetical protein